MARKKFVNVLALEKYLNLLRDEGVPEFEIEDKLRRWLKESKISRKRLSIAIRTDDITMLGYYGNDEKLYREINDFVELKLSGAITKPTKRVYVLDYLDDWLLVWAYGDALEKEYSKPITPYFVYYIITLSKKGYEPVCDRRGVEDMILVDKVLEVI
jgi:hypothetical protein